LPQARLLHYVSDTRQDQLKHINSIARIEEDKYVWLDRFTIRNLELVNSANEKAVTLIDIMITRSHLWITPDEALDHASAERAYCH